jgi:flavodoxin
MKRNLLILVLLLTSATGFAQSSNDKNNMENMESEKKNLVAFFSRADENYAVGYIEKGNTHIVAEMIAAETGADLFHIETEKPYPADYNQCIEVAKREKNANARPAVRGDVRVEDYDVIYLGYPNWWGEMPMAVYTFIEKHDWHGKTVVPFCTHEGSGLSGTERRVQSACEGAKVLKGLAVRGATAQNEPATALKAVMSWLKNTNL